MAFHFMYGVGRLQHRTTCVLINFNRMTILLKRVVLLALRLQKKHLEFGVTHKTIWHNLNDYQKYDEPRNVVAVSSNIMTHVDQRQ